MKLFSFRIRAISVFILESGTSTRRCFDPHALRIRVNMSAIGSVIDIELLTPLLSYPLGTCRNQSEFGLPTRLPDTGNHPVQRQLPETDPADAKSTQVCTRAAAATAPVVCLHAKLWLALALLDPGLLCHWSLRTSSPVHVAGTGDRIAACPRTGVFFSSIRNGMPSSRSNANASSSRLVDVTNVMSIPWICSISS